MKIFVTTLLFINAILVIVVQIRFAAKGVEIEFYRRLFLALTGFTLGGLAVLFFAAAQTEPIENSTIGIVILVGIFSASGFGWSIPQKMRRVYRRKK